MPFLELSEFDIIPQIFLLYLKVDKLVNARVRAEFYLEFK